MTGTETKEARILPGASCGQRRIVLCRDRLPPSPFSAAYSEWQDAAVNFADRLIEQQRKKHSALVLGIDPQLDSAAGPGVPPGMTLRDFCCEIIEACAPVVVAVKPQLAFFEARGLEGMKAFSEVTAAARRCGLLTIADAKRADIGSTSAAYARAFLGIGDFACDAITVNPYLGTDAVAPFLDYAGQGRGIFVLVKTSNPSSVEFQELSAPERPLWETVARRVDEWSRESVGSSSFSSVGAVLGATFPKQAIRGRVLMPNAIVLAPGLGAQGASAQDAVAAAGRRGLGVIVNASRALMYAFRGTPGTSPAAAANAAALAMRDSLNAALAATCAKRGEEVAF